MSRRPLDLYPDSFGAHRGCVFPHAGPAVYAPLTYPSPLITPGGGDLVYGAEAGLKYFDIVLGSLSDDGLYVVESVPTTPSTPQPGAPCNPYRLRWLDSATGAEVSEGVDLSASIVRLFALGPK